MDTTRGRRRYAGLGNGGHPETNSKQASAKKGGHLWWFLGVQSSNIPPRGLAQSPTGSPGREGHQTSPRPPADDAVGPTPDVCSRLHWNWGDNLHRSGLSGQGMACAPRTPPQRPKASTLIPRPCAKPPPTPYPRGVIPLLTPSLTAIPQVCFTAISSSRACLHRAGGGGAAVIEEGGGGAAVIEEGARRGSSARGWGGWAAHPLDWG